MPGVSSKLRSVATILLLVGTSVLTLVLAGRTFWYLFSSVSNVPYNDLWVLLQEVQEKQKGVFGWSYLWSPYWGQRPLIPRLLILLSARHFHYFMLPFTVISVAAQVSTLVVLLWLIRRLFPNRGLIIWAASVAAAHLLLSSLQMESFIEAIGVQYTVGYGAAVAAIGLFAVAGDSRRLGPRFWLVVLLGAVSSACVAIGPLVWPILIFQAWVSRAGRRPIAFLTSIGVVVVGFYFIDYTRPTAGLGFAGAFLHPMTAFAATAMVLGGPISIYSHWLGIVAGAIGLAIAMALVFRFDFRSVQPASLGIVLIAVFMTGSAASIAIGRFTADWLDPNVQPLPSRYLLPTLLFWAALFPASLASWRAGARGRGEALTTTLLILVLTFGTWNWQWQMSRAWASISENYDAVASGFLAGVSDPVYMSRMVEDGEIRGRMLEYMRREKLSVFAEPRAGWMGRQIADIASMDGRTTCQGTIQTAEPMNGDALSFRITGTVSRDGLPRRLDILMVDDAGTVRGLARTIPIFTEQNAALGFWGYARGVPSQKLRLFAMLRGKLVACPI